MGNPVGSAANPVDLPIPERHKLDVQDPAFVQRFGQVAGDVLANFEGCTREFDAYRAVIQREPQEFDRHIVAAFGIG